MAAPDAPRPRPRPPTPIRMAANALRVKLDALRDWIRLHGSHDPSGLAVQASELLSDLNRVLEAAAARSDRAVVTGGPSTDAVQAALCDATGSIPGSPIADDDEEDDEETLAERIASLEAWAEEMLQAGNDIAYRAAIANRDKLAARQRPLVLTGPGGDFTTAHYAPGARTDARA